MIVVVLFCSVWEALRSYWGSVCRLEVHPHKKTRSLRSSSSNRRVISAEIGSCQLLFNAVRRDYRPRDAGDKRTRMPPNFAQAYVACLGAW
ncbi:hypothetical protein DFJ73DRAFT_851568, partial [Zopfochytrium polystomum]